MEELILGDIKKETIQFLHANAYTPGCYKVLFSNFDNYKIALPRQRPLWPASQASDLRSWDLFAEDLIKHMDGLGRRGVIGIGHSLGGVASWLAAIKRPELFSRLILIDPVILPASYTTGLQFFPYSLKKMYLPIIRTASRRRDFWVNREAARDYFLSKKVFQRFHPGVFEDFLTHGLRDVPEGVRLSFPRDWESRIYASPPNLWHKMKKTPCPITIIRAEYSDVIDTNRWNKIQKKVADGQFVQMNAAGHLVPFERPQECAEVIINVLNDIY